MLSYILSYGNWLLKDQKGKRALEMTIRQARKKLKEKSQRRRRELSEGLKNPRPP
jgi:hypothetical protein